MESFCIYIIQQHQHSKGEWYQYTITNMNTLILLVGPASLIYILYESSSSCWSVVP